jgi:nicotinamidase-related amidase
MSLKILPGRLEDVIDATEGLAVVVIDMQTRSSFGGMSLEGRTELKRMKEVLRYANGKGLPIYFIEHEAYKGSESQNPTISSLTECAPKGYETIIKKRYSAFDGTKLGEKLNGENGVRPILVVGWSMNHCVGESVRDTPKNGFSVITARSVLIGRGEPNANLYKNVTFYDDLHAT